MSEHPDGALAAAAPVSLPELEREAALLVRTDRKYVVPARMLGGLVSSVTEAGRVLEIDGNRSFRYRSVYFDTEDLRAYLAAARRRRRRFKLRTRSYLDSGQCWLEVKTPGSRGETVKHRWLHPPELELDVRPGRPLVDEVLATAGIRRPHELGFRSTLVSGYRRSTIALPGRGGAGPAGAAGWARVTLDTGLVWEGADGGRLALPGLAVVETKTGSTPCAVDRLLWSRGHRPVRISKYATALAAMHPDLPAHPWQRTIDRCFTRP